MLLRFNPFTLIHEKIIREDRYIEFIIINPEDLEGETLCFASLWGY